MPSDNTLNVKNGDVIHFRLQLANSEKGAWALFWDGYPVIPASKATGLNIMEADVIVGEEEGTTFDAIYAVYPVGTIVTNEKDYSRADSYEKWLITIRNTATNPDVIKIVDFNPKDSNININDSITFSVAVNKACSIVWKLNGSTKYSGSIGASNLFSQFMQTFTTAGTYTIEAICTEGSVEAKHVWNITLEDNTPITDVLKITPVSPSKTTFNVGESVGFSILTNNTSNINWYKNNILQKSSVNVTTGTFMTTFLDAGNNVIKVEANDNISVKIFTWNVTIAANTDDPTNNDSSGGTTLLFAGLLGVSAIAAISMMKKQTEYKKARTE